jgi:putative Mn2+ efflux pump MntP
VVGAGLAFADGNIISTATIVALITATLSFIAVFVGERLGHVFEEKAELIGGIVLILIGIKIVLEHIGLLV